LDIEDKHKLLLIVGGAHSSTYMVTDKPRSQAAGSATSAAPSFLASQSFPLEDNSEILRIDGRQRDEGLEVLEFSFDFDIDFDITFRSSDGISGNEVVPTLKAHVAYVNRVIDMIERIVF
jgi:hypothetical protein